MWFIETEKIILMIFILFMLVGIIFVPWIIQPYNISKEDLKNSLKNAIVESVYVSIAYISGIIILIIYSLIKKYN